MRIIYAAMLAAILACSPDTPTATEPSAKINAMLDDICFMDTVLDTIADIGPPPRS